MMAKWTYEAGAGDRWSPFKLNGDAVLYSVVLILLKEGEDAKAEVERLKAELAKTRENERSQRELNANQAVSITSLRAELAKAKDEADARVQEVISTAEAWYGKPIECLSKHRPKPKFVWMAHTDSCGNTYWTCNGNRNVTCSLRNDRVMWWAACPGATPFETADEAKAAVERHLMDGKR